MGLQLALVAALAIATAHPVLQEGVPVNFQIEQKTGVVFFTFTPSTLAAQFSLNSKADGGYCTARLFTSTTADRPSPGNFEFSSLTGRVILHIVDTFGQGQPVNIGIYPALSSPPSLMEVAALDCSIVAKSGIEIPLYTAMPQRVPVCCTDERGSNDWSYFVFPEGFSTAGNDVLLTVRKVDAATDFLPVIFASSKTKRPNKDDFEWKSENVNDTAIVRIKNAFGGPFYIAATLPICAADCPFYEFVAVFTRPQCILIPFCGGCLKTQGCGFCNANGVCLDGDTRGPWPNPYSACKGAWLFGNATALCV